MKEYVKFVPLGGLGRMGFNCAVYETQNDMIIVDCGSTLPYVEEPGVQYVIPDLTYVYEKREKLRAIFITHAHEDHIGALPFILKNLTVPVYGTRFTLGLIELKFREHGIETELRMLSDAEIVKQGDFAVQAIAVTHSIPESVAFAIKTSTGTLIHTGDFKIDAAPLDNRLTQSEIFQAYGDEGVLALLSDSTNAMEHGTSRSEKIVSEALSRVIAKAPARVLLTTFSSHIHRLQAAVDASLEHGRFIFFVGRSMQQYTQLAMAEGYLNIPPDKVLDISQFEALPKEKITLIASGTQGEIYSTVTRIALGDYPDVFLEKNDQVIWSARKIPGNERSIGNMMNAFAALGVEIIDERKAPIHASGHAYQEEHKLMLQWCQPRYFIPLHGERRQLEHHAVLAKEMGVAEANVLVIENGEPTMWHKEGEHLVVTRAEKVPAKAVYVDGSQVGDVTRPTLNERLTLSKRGLVAAWLVIRDNLVEEPEIYWQGLTSYNPNTWLAEAKHETQKAVERALEKPGEDLQEAMRLALRRFFKQRWQRNPVLVCKLFKF